MKRRHTLSRSVSDADPAFDLSSLIDISFLLLIYFLATSTLHKPELDLEMTLAGEGQGSTIDRMEISIDPQGQIAVQDEVVEFAGGGSELIALGERLSLYKTTADLMGSEPLVIVKADDSSRSQRFIDVLNCIAGERIEHVTLAGFSP